MEWILNLIPGGSLTAIVGAIIAGLGILWGIMRGQKKAGRNEVLVEQKRKDDATRKKFEKIDSAPPDLDASLDRLSKRSQRNSNSNTPGSTAKRR